MENITGYEGSIVICNAHIPSDNLEDGSKLYDLTCINGIITSIGEAGCSSDPSDTPVPAVHKMDVGGGLVLPG
ncbi:hypothetical protein PHLCEN_2v9505 [Hermanssonia centrifuga]|uniref:Uncharacterized protein n=1 Tax=Hermanssonia centrifuga TaxID=98765 RepID=A0A2R6NQK5_9APHY|nr:hypothetical protein PHLCEN_2v9505 [Hermanssonia centrifuga]